MAYPNLPDGSGGRRPRLPATTATFSPVKSPQSPPSVLPATPTVSTDDPAGQLGLLTASYHAGDYGQSARARQTSDSDSSDGDGDIDDFGDSARTDRTFEDDGPALDHRQWLQMIGLGDWCDPAEAGLPAGTQPLGTDPVPDAEAMLRNLQSVASRGLAPFADLLPGGFAAGPALPCASGSGGQKRSRGHRPATLIPPGDITGTLYALFPRFPATVTEACNELARALDIDPPNPMVAAISLQRIGFGVFAQPLSPFTMMWLGRLAFAIGAGEIPMPATLADLAAAMRLRYGDEVD